MFLTSFRGAGKVHHRVISSALRSAASSSSSTCPFLSIFGSSVIPPPRQSATFATTTTTSSTNGSPVIEHHVVNDPKLKDVYFVPKSAREHAHISSMSLYAHMYARSLSDPSQFWGKIADSFSWYRKWDTVVDADFVAGNIKWFQGAKLNVTENALDRHIAAGYGDRPAMTWESDDGKSITYSFSQLLEQVNAMATVLSSHGVKKGDTVSICMPMVPQLLFSTLACARIGAIHSVIFAGFSSEAVADRIVNCQSQVVLTTDAGVRGGRVVPLKSIVDKGIEIAETREGAGGKKLKIRRVLVCHRAGEGAKEGSPGWVTGRDVSLDAEIEQVFRIAKEGNNPVIFKPAVMDAEDPLFILYTSGSTGKPKGVLHTTAGYMVWAATTFKYVFDTRPSAAAYPTGSPIKPDVHFCTADMGWVTGHSYISYGPLVNGTHTVMFEGTPTYPGPNRLWDIVEKHKVTTFYTAPTAIRALMVHGEEHVKKHDISTLRILGSVGEPINAEAWRWYHSVIGNGKLPIVDTFWQTETGGVMITSLPGATPMKPSMATKPFFGIDAKIVRQDGTECDPNEGGYLVFDKAWPGMMRTVYGDHERFRQTYFSQMPGRYFTGDGAVRDKDGDIQITGRVDDVVNVSGHRLGTAEVESALSLHADVAESAVVGFPHAIKGEGLYAFVILRKGAAAGGNASSSSSSASATLTKELIATVRKAIGPIATPDVIHVVSDLPKTRSGKILRRVLRKVAAGATDTSPATMGDLSSIADGSVVDMLIKTRPVTTKG